MAEPKPNKDEQSPEKRISALRRERDAIRRLLQQGALTRVGRELESQHRTIVEIESLLAGE
jgi:hypothetical protein